MYILFLHSLLENDEENVIDGEADNKLSKPRGARLDTRVATTSFAPSVTVVTQ